jgi:hypothetical protein
MTALTPATPLRPYPAPCAASMTLHLATRAGRLAALLLGVLTAPACAKGERESSDTTAAAQGSAAGDAASASAGEWMSDRDVNALAAHRLTDDRVDKLERGVRNLTQLNRSDPGVLKRFEAKYERDSSEDFSIDEIVREVESEPKLRRAIEDGGLSVRDFMLTYFSLAFANSMKDPQQQQMPDTTNMTPEMREQMRQAMRPLQEMMDRMKRAVSQENVDYVRRNEARVQRIIAAMEAIDPDDEQETPGDTTGR